MKREDGITIWVFKKDKQRLDKLRRYPRETVGDILHRILDEREGTQEKEN